LAFGGFFFGTQRFDFSLSLIDRASALYRIGSGLGFDAAGRGKRYPVGEVAALARAKQGARYPLHAAVEQPTDSPEAVAAERGGYLVHLLEPSRWQANANQRVTPGPRPTTFSTAFFHRILVGPFPSCSPRAQTRCNWDSSRVSAGRVGLVPFKIRSI
jgi:hypothetical protein